MTAPIRRATRASASPGARTADLRSAMAGVRALLLDLDGVIVLKGELLPGARDALAEVEARAIPYRIVTNTSLISRPSLSRWADRLAAPIPASRIMSALSASAAYTRHRFPGEPLFVMASTDALTEFAGQRLLRAAEADAPNARAAAVVIGDAPDAVNFDNLNRAFRLVRSGAELIGMHRNPWWLTPEGPTLDSGAIVTGLEFATERPARILGKPSPDFFREAAAELVDEIREAGGRRLRRREIAMVGDDLRSDILAAQRVGLRGVFVLSGKHALTDVETVARGRGGRIPDGIAPTLLEVVLALG
jgi:HAD superfamily hydrolase (TIGR01458 family)